MTGYVRNAWYVAAWEEEINGDQWLVRRLLGEPCIIFRKLEAPGGYAMLKDRCPHRFAPLSMGNRQGDNLVCRYHGLAFAPDGACVHAPAVGGGVAHIRATAIPVIARHSLLWFWPGEPALADPAAIPDFSFLDAQRVTRGRSLFAGNYELLTDNLMDLSHVDHLHASTFGSQGADARTRFEVHDGDRDTIWAEWRIADATKLPMLDPVLKDLERIDQLMRMRWSAPASMALGIHWIPAGGTLDQAAFSMINPHIVTPETDASSHYFWTCEPGEESERFARSVFETEDRPVIEAVQTYMDGRDFWQLKPAILKQDLGAVRARRRLIKLRHAELTAGAESTMPPVADVVPPGTDAC